MPEQTYSNKKFQSTLPLRGVTGMVQYASTGYLFQSTLPLRGVT